MMYCLICIKSLIVRTLDLELGYLLSLRTRLTIPSHAFFLLSRIIQNSVFLHDARYFEKCDQFQQALLMINRGGITNIDTRTGIEEREIWTLPKPKYFFKCINSV